MGNERWPEIERLYHSALERPPNLRTEFLRAACSGDEFLAREVASLLQQASTTEEFLNVKALDLAATTLAIGVPETAGQVIGPYRLLEEIGHGGMGQVWRAEQTEPVRRRVALKLIKAGMDTREVVARFESERRALALMEHPAIAKVFDAGSTPQGVPYFAMEYVAGAPITTYCDDHRLSIHERLELFVRVCEGVQHAHQKAIIHRDLKPSNILVTEIDGRPAPKIIDFGIARALNQKLIAETMYTRAGALVGTPEYMSPEQGNSSGEDLDTRSDVYSLGIVFYELLAGVPPLQLHRVSLEEFLRRLREDEPAKPSTKVRTHDPATSTAVAGRRGSDPLQLVRQMRGELDAIALKALEKDRSRRYGSPYEFAADISRYLRNEPVLAVAPSAAYRARKFVRRYRKLLAATATFIAMLLVAVVVSSWLALRASRAEQETRAVNDFLQKDLLAQASVYGQATAAARVDPDIKVRTALDRAAERIDGKFRSQPLVEASLRQTIGDTYAHLGLYPAAERQILRVIELRSELLGPRNPDTLASMASLVAVYMGQGNYPQAEQVATKVLEARRQMLGDENPDTIRSQRILAGVYFDQSKLALAEKLDAHAFAAAHRVWGDDNPDTLLIMDSLARTYKHEGKFARAESLYTRALEARRRISGPEHPETLQVMNDLGGLYSDEGKYDLAEPLQTATLEVRRRVLGAEHPRTLQSMNNVAEIYLAEGRYAEAEQLLTSCLESRRRISGAGNVSTLIVMGNLAVLYGAEGRYREAEALFAETLEVQRRSLGAEHDRRLDTINDVAGMYLAEGKYSQAESTYAEVVELRRRVIGAEHPSTVNSLAGLGHALLLQHKYIEAESALRSALSSYVKSRPDTWERYSCESMLGASLAGQRKFAQAEPLLISGYEGMNLRQAMIPVPERINLRDAQGRIVQLYNGWGKQQKAAEWRMRLQQVPADIR